MKSFYNHAYDYTIDKFFLSISYWYGTSIGSIPSSFMTVSTSSVDEEVFIRGSSTSYPGYATSTAQVRIGLWPSATTVSLDIFNYTDVDVTVYLSTSSSHIDIAAGGNAVLSFKSPYSTPTLIVETSNAVPTMTSLNAVVI